MTYYIAEIRLNKKRTKPKREKETKERKLAYVLTSVVATILILATFFTISKAFSTDESEITDSLEQLSEEILALPDDAFYNPRSSAGHKAALSNKIKAVAHQTNAGAYDGALNKLQNDIKASIIEWIDPAYTADLTALVDEIIGLIQEITEPTPDFSLKVDPDTLTVEQGTADATIITIESLNEFNLPVNLTITSPPIDGITTTLDPSQATPPPNSAVHSALTIEVALTTMPTTYTITVKGNANSLEHSANVSLLVISPPPAPDFSLDAFPSSLIINKGNGNTSLLAVASLANFSQPVDLNVTSAPITGVTATLNPPLVIPPANNSAISILTVEVTPEAPTGSYSITVAGTSNSLQHNVDILLEITEPPVPSHPDFSIAAFPPSLTIQTGASTTSTIVVTSLQDFNQPVDLTITSTPIPDVTITTDVFIVTPQPNDFVTATLTATIGPLATPEDYTITITGTSDTLEHSTSIPLTVTIENVPPEIVNILRLPHEPSYTDSVTILAGIVDPNSGVEDVIMGYASDAEWKNVTMISKEDAIYKASIRPYSFNTTIRYRIYASDKAGNTASSHLYSYVTADPYPPKLGIPTWHPEMPDPDMNVTINVAVTEPREGSGLENTTLWYNATGEWQSAEMILANGNWTAAIPGQSGEVPVVFYVEAYDKAGNSAVTETFEYLVSVAPWPLAWIAGIALGVAALTAAVIFIAYRNRKKRSARGLTNLKHKPVISLYIPARILNRDRPTIERDG